MCLQNSYDTVVKSSKTSSRARIVKDEADGNAIVISDDEKTDANTPMESQRDAGTTPFRARDDVDGSQPVIAANDENCDDQQEDNDHPTAIQHINNVLGEASELDTQVHNFRGATGDKEFLALEEKLTCLMLRLDAIDCGCDEQNKRDRGNAIRNLQQLSDLLDAKASGDV